MKINPTFKLCYQLVKSIPFLIIPSVIMMLIITHYFDEILYPIIYSIAYIYNQLIGLEGISDAHAKICSIFGLLFYPILLLLLTAFIIKLFYNRVTFSLDDTGITYTINFIIYSQKHVNYSDIKEINLDQGPLQRLFKLATIKITTHATTANAGIELYNLKPYHEVYEFLMSKKNSK